MREVRPTIKVLKSLPRGTFTDTTPLDLIANDEFTHLNLYGVQQTLLEDARRRFQSGFPDRHIAASRTYGAPVYEVRDRDGAGWRGAVILDDAGDPWLVWAERHNPFHKKVASVSFSALLPSEAEYKLRAREEAALEVRNWERGVLRSFVNALRESVMTGRAVTATVTGATPHTKATLEVEAMHDTPSDDVTQATESMSLLTISLRITGEGWGEFESALTRICLPFLEPDPTRIEATFGKDNSLISLIEIDHAKIIQLLADPPPYEGTSPPEVSPPDRLHYVGVEYMLEGYVNGAPLRGVCGVWFVASRSEECGLPVCEQCEDEKPAAQRVLDLLRSSSE